MKVLFRIVLLLCSLLLAGFIFMLFIFRDRRPRIYFAADTGDTNLIAHYIASGTNVNDLILCYPFGGNRDLAPMLDIALQNGQVKTVEFLLKNGANPNQPDSNGETPLMCVIGQARNEVTVETKAQLLRILLEAGADPNLRSSNGFWTPLIQAVDFGQIDAAKILLSRGASVSETNSEGSTPLHFAENAEVVKLLISAGADPNARTSPAPEGETPGDSALRFGHLSALKLLTNLSALTNN
jgi:ankyrin repeat protein